MFRFSVLKAILVAFTALFLTLPATAAESGYVLGPNDTITVQVYGQPEAGVGSTRIKSDGTIVMPLLGTIKAEGETPLTLAELIKKKFVAGGFFKSPFVNVEVGAYVSRTINVSGKVTSPGVFPLDKEYRVSEVLLKSGWLRAEGAEYVYLRRAGDSKQITLDAEALARGTPDKDPIVAPGDTLFVPDAETYYLSGQVARPGVYPIKKGVNLREALIIAGGVTAAGSERKVALVRAGAKETKAKLDDPIQAKDIYIVKERLF